MASPINGDDQPAVSQASGDAGRAGLVHGLAPAGPSWILQPVTLPVADDADPEPSDLVAHALAILEREQERWRSSRSLNLAPGSRS